MVLIPETFGLYLGDSILRYYSTSFGYTCRGQFGSLGYYVAGTFGHIHHNCIPILTISRVSSRFSDHGFHKGLLVAINSR